jgi:pimeloyl-ACP methyl ester carboxylesterase
VTQTNTSSLNEAESCCLTLDGVERRYFWLASGTNWLFACLHLPESGQTNGQGLVICNPFGHEYVHAHRSLKTLADLAAKRGVPTLRFDYVGTGDSQGNLVTDADIESFLHNIHCAVDFMKYSLGVSSIELLGLRLGASLAALYAERYSVDQLLLWAPCLSGRQFVREQKAIARLASFQQLSEQDYIESAGFILSSRFSTQLSSLHIDIARLNCAKLVVIERDDRDELADFNNTNLSVSYELRRLKTHGYQDMMAEPQDNKVPIETLQNIIATLFKKPFAGESYQTDKLQMKSQLGAVTEFENLVESIKIVNDQLVSIITLSRDRMNTRLPCLILVNSGSVHHVGPNRLYTELARNLAHCGYMVIRFDLQNLGESSFFQADQDNNPYPATSSDNIYSLIQFVKEFYQPEKIIIAGLCSGAHNAFHTPLEIENSRDITEVIMINPLAFYRRPEKFIDNQGHQAFARDLSQYRKSVFSLSKWKKFLSGKVSLSYILRFVVKGFSGIFNLLVIRLLRLLGIQRVTQLGQDLLRYKSMSIPLTFIIAEQDPGKTLLHQSGGNTVRQLLKEQSIRLYDIPSADHTFSTSESRERLFQCLKQHLVKDDV